MENSLCWDGWDVTSWVGWAELPTSGSGEGDEPWLTRGSFAGRQSWSAEQTWASRTDWVQG